MKIISVKIADLKQHPFHEKMYSSRNIEELADSIKLLGLLSPLLIDRKNQVLSGWRRLLAARLLQLEDIVVEYYDDMPPDQEMSLIIDSNKQRIKTMLEKWNEIQELKRRWTKTPGERTDKNSKLSTEEKKHTKDRIASAMGISTGNVHKIERIAAKDKSLFALIDTGEISIHEAYNRCAEKVPVSKATKTAPSQSARANTPVASARNSTPKPLEKLYAHTCPHCGEKFND